jgi:hypothetical protein
LRRVEKLADQISTHVTTGREGMLATILETVKSRWFVVKTSPPTTRPHGWLGIEPSNYTLWLLRRGNPKRHKKPSWHELTLPTGRRFARSPSFQRFIRSGLLEAAGNPGQLLFSPIGRRGHAR